MKLESDLQNMLDDVLHDDKIDALKEDLHRRCRAELARKRRNRIRVWMIPAAAAMLFVLFRLIIWIDPQGAPAPGGFFKEGPPPYYVTSRSSPPVPRISTARAGTGSFAVQTEKTSGHVVSTTGSQAVERLTDEEMFALFPGTPCGLVARGAGQKELIFLNPEDKDRLFIELGG
jgi:hypothetical protein